MVERVWEVWEVWGVWSVWEEIKKYIFSPLQCRTTKIYFSWLIGYGAGNPSIPS
ncbi:MAG: hypothetical protein F6K40_23885 [Okeania sp. SIO3I5]|uniref:hypothetical protein n=1 Tax=Okeania sp. SIO3I5 TaxID=2607805 RepID=UPI0013B98B6A|nr:hypothetical protein [Okeania sp. SIO3I5]NEQ39129.1 hypothetical protein [Okeania sp. SIO3I5]